MDFGIKGTAQGEMMNPIVAVLDSEGNIYIADHGNQKIQIWG